MASRSRLKLAQSPIIAPAYKNDTAKNNTKDLNGEIGDVLMMLLALCRTLDVDLLQAFKDKELVNCNRNWQ